MIRREREGEAYLWGITSGQVLDLDSAISAWPGSRRLDTLLLFFDLEIQVLADTLDAVKRDFASAVETDDPENGLVER
jgi:hypothetical protein